MKRQLIMIGIAVISACTSISLMWFLWTGIFYVMEMVK